MSTAICRRNDFNTVYADAKTVLLTVNTKKRNSICKKYFLLLFALQLSLQFSPDFYLINFTCMLYLQSIIISGGLSESALW